MRQFRIVDLGEHSIHCQEVQRIEEAVKKIFGELTKQSMSISSLKNRTKFDTMLALKQKGSTAGDHSNNGRLSVGGARMGHKAADTSRSQNRLLRRLNTNESSADEDESPDKQPTESQYKKPEQWSRDGFSSPRKTQMSSCFDTINEHSEEELTTPETRRVKSRFQNSSPDNKSIPTGGTRTNIIHPMAVQLEDIQFENRQRVPRVPVIVGLDTLSIDKPRGDANQSSHSKDGHFHIKLEHANSRESIINCLSQRTPEATNKQRSVQDGQVGHDHQEAVEKSSANFSESSDRKYNAKNERWLPKQSASETGEQGAGSTEPNDHHLGSSRSGSQGHNHAKGHVEPRVSTLSVKDARIPKPHSQNTILNGKLGDSKMMKPKFSERAITPSNQQRLHEQFGAPESPVLQKRFLEGRPNKGLVMNPVKQYQTEGNFSVRLSVRALPVDGSARTIKAGQIDFFNPSHSGEIDSKNMDYREDTGMETSQMKSEIHAAILTKIAEMYEAYESYIKDISKDQYNLQPDIELESKIAELIQALAGRIKLNIQPFMKPINYPNQAISSSDLASSETHHKQKKAQSLQLEPAFAEVFELEETRSRVRELIPFHNLVMESLTKRKALVGRFKALDNTTNQHVQNAIKDNDGQESSKIASVQTQKAKKAVTSMSFRFKKKAIGFGLQLGLKGLLNTGDKIEEDENENRMSVRSIAPLGCLSQQTKSDAKFEFQGSAQESRFAELNRKGSDTFSNSVGLAGSQKGHTAQPSHFESYAQRASSQDQKSVEMNNTSPPNLKTKFGISALGNNPEKLSSPRSVDSPSNVNHPRAEHTPTSKLSEIDQKTLSKAQNSSPRVSALASNLELPRVVSPLIAPTKPSESGEQTKRTPISLANLVRDRMKLRGPGDGPGNSFVQRMPFGNSLSLNSARGTISKHLSPEELNKLIYPKVKKPHKYIPGMEIVPPPPIVKSRFAKLESNQSSMSQQSDKCSNASDSGEEVLMPEVASKASDQDAASDLDAEEHENRNVPENISADGGPAKCYPGTAGVRQTNNTLTVFQLDHDEEKASLQKAQLESMMGDFSPRNLGSLRSKINEDIFQTKLAKAQAESQNTSPVRQAFKRSGSSVGTFTTHQLPSVSVGKMKTQAFELKVEHAAVSTTFQPKMKHIMPSVPEFHELRYHGLGPDSHLDAGHGKLSESRQDIQLCYSKSVSLKGPEAGAGDMQDSDSASKDDSGEESLPESKPKKIAQPIGSIHQQSKHVSHNSMNRLVPSGPGSPGKKFTGFNVFKVKDAGETPQAQQRKSMIPFVLDQQSEDEADPKDPTSGRGDLTGSSANRKFDFKSKPSPIPALSRKDSTNSRNSSSWLRHKYQNSRFRSSLDWQDIQQPSHDSGTPSPVHQSMKNSTSKESLTSAERQAERELRLNEANFVDVPKADWVRLTKSDSEIIVPTYREDLFESPKVSIQDFDFIKKLGKGAYGTVYLVRRKNTSDYYAMKIIQFPKDLDEQFVQNVINENEVFKMVEDKYVVTALFTFIHKNYICFVMEWMKGGDFKTILEENTYLAQDVVQFYMAELILAVEYLHSKGIMHRDLKPDNILIDSKGHLKLTDFGLSGIKEKVPLLEISDPQGEHLGFINSIPTEAGLNGARSLEGGSNEENGTSDRPYAVLTTQRQNSQALTDMAATSLAGRLPRSQHSQEDNEPPCKEVIPEKIRIVGTPDYIAPEILNGTSEEVFASDWWAVGIITYESLVGIPPFNDKTPEKVFENIQKNKMEWPEIGRESVLTAGYVEGSSITPEAQDLIQKFLLRDPANRLGMNGTEEIRQHPFFRGNIEWEDLHSQEPPEIVMEKLKASENIKDMAVAEDAHKVFEDMCRVESPGKSVGVRGKKLEQLDMVRFDLLHHKNLKAYDNMIEEKKKCEERMTYIDKTLGLNRQLGFY